MADYLWNIVEVNVVLAVLFGVFRLVRNRLSFTVQRFVLLAVPALAILVTIFRHLPASELVGIRIPVIVLDTVRIGRDAGVAEAEPGLLSADVFYWAGVLLLAGWMCWKLYRILRLFRHSALKKEEGFSVAELPGQDSFSFFRLIMLRAGLGHAERQIVLEHEQIHARKLHSLDLLYLETVHCFSWFNPVLPFLKKELIHIHEFEVDSIMYRQHRVSYMEALLSYSLGTSSSTYLFTNQFLAKLTLIKRINSMKHTTKKRWILALALPVTAGVLALVSWTTGTNETPERGLNEHSRMIAESTAPETGTKADPMAGEPVREIAETKEIAEKAVPEKSVDTKMAEELTEPEGKMAEFVGGTEGMTAYLVNNIRYPEKAAKENVTGKVIVSFVVTKTGKVSNVAVKKGVSPEIDAEAVRVIKGMPDWIPGEEDGKKIDTELCLPVAFRL